MEAVIQHQQVQLHGLHVAALTPLLFMEVAVTIQQLLQVVGITIKIITLPQVIHLLT